MLWVDLSLLENILRFLRDVFMTKNRQQRNRDGWRSVFHQTQRLVRGEGDSHPLKPTGRTPAGFQMLSYYRGSLWMAESNRFHGNTCSKNQLPPLQRLNHLKALEPERGEREREEGKGERRERGEREREERERRERDREEREREHLISSPDGKTLYQALLSRPLPVQKTPSSSGQTQSQCRLYLVLIGYTLSPW